MKKLTKFLVLSVATLFTLTGCGNKEPSSSATSAPTSSSEPQVIGVDSVTLNKNTLSLYLNESEYLKATIAPENASVKRLNWTSSDEDIVSVSNTGKVIALGLGTATVKATSEYDSTKFDECVVTVTRKDTTIHVTDVLLDKEKAEIGVGDQVQLNASVLPEDATEKGIVWTSSNSAVALVTSEGLVAGLSIGTATIRAASKEKATIYKECTVKVIDTTVHVETVEVSPKSISLDLGGETTARPTATVLPAHAADKSLTWTSSDTEKVIVDSRTGVITAKAETTEDVVITATSNDNEGASDTLTVSVEDTRDPEIHVTGVSLPATLELDLKDGATDLLVAEITPPNAWNKKVNWSSSNDDIVTVESSADNTAVVTGLTKGSATITATSEDNEEAYAHCVVTFVDSQKHVTGVSIVVDEEETDPLTPIEIKRDAIKSVYASVVPADADVKGITWAYVDDAEDYVTLLSLSTGDISIMGKEITTDPVKVRAYSVEYPTIYKELLIDVTDPTIYATGVSVKISESEVGTEPVNIEYLKNLSLTASVLPENATDKNIDWSIQTTDGDQYITLSYETGANQTITGKKLTQYVVDEVEYEKDIVVRASAHSDPTKFKDIIIHVIDPTNVDRFSEFVDPESIIFYKDSVDSSNLNSITNVYNKADLENQYFDYENQAEKLAKMRYKVGDQGIWSFMPRASIKKAGETTPTIISNPSVSTKLYLIDDLVNPVEVDMDDYVSVDLTGYGYDFKDNAVGHAFRFEFKPTSAYLHYDEAEPYLFDFDVVKAYNVDTVAELSLFDNSQTVWDDFKRSQDLDGVVAEGGIILHKNISLSASIIPSQFTYSQAEAEQLINDYAADFDTYWHNVGFESFEEAKEAFIGSPIDYKTIFNRSAIVDEEEFTFNGNFFNLDCSSIRPIIRLMPEAGADPTKPFTEGYAGDGSHSQLFGFNVEGATTGYANQVNITNIAVTGNGGLSDDAHELKMSKGGLILFKDFDAALSMENVLSSKAFIFLLTAYKTAGTAQQKLTSFTGDRLIAQDCYSSVFHIWGTRNNTMTNSYTSHAGGPIFLFDECLDSSPSNPSDRYTQFDATNCYMHSYVSGSEPWFVDHSTESMPVGSLVSNYIVGAGVGDKAWFSGLSIDQYQQGKGQAKTIAGNVGGYNVCDMIAIDVCVSFIANNDKAPLGGQFTIHNGNDVASLMMSDVTKNAGHTTSLVPTDYAPIIVKSNVGATGNLGVAHLSSSKLPVAISANGEAFSGNYFSFFMDPALALMSSPQYEFIGAMLGGFSLI